MFPVDVWNSDVVKCCFEFENFVQYYTECVYVTCGYAIDPINDDLRIPEYVDTIAMVAQSKME